MQKVLRLIDLNRIVFGSAFLGSGGGGSINTGLKFAQEISERSESVTLLSLPLEEENENLLACIVCDIGSISSIDKYQTNAIETAFKALQRQFEYLGTIGAVFPIETGPENTMVPFVIASRFGIPVINGDGAGRAVPTLPVTSFSTSEELLNWTPISIANGMGDVMLVHSTSFRAIDKKLRRVASIKDFSNSASLALWPDSVRNLSKRCIPDTVSKSLKCGEFFEGVRTNNFELISQSLSIVNQLEAFLITAGTIISTSKSDIDGFYSTRVTLSDVADRKKVTILGKNESLIVYSEVSSSPLALAPDSICYLDHEFQPLTNVEITKGQKVYIICVKAHDKLSQGAVITGFKGILLKLGFAGNITPNTFQYQKLGQLILEIKEKSVFL